MRKKKIISLLLSVIMIFGLMTTVFADDAETINVFVNVSKYGELIKDQNENTLAFASVELTGKAAYTLDDLFKALHDTYYDGGSAAGYSSADGAYGRYVTKFWGDESGNFGYQVNGGAESVMGLSHEVKSGDHIDIAINKNLYPDTESYTTFDTYEAELYSGEKLELTLTQAGYDENFNMVFSPCENAVITINGKETESITDEAGKATISFDNSGKYIISAVKEKNVNEERVTAITAPVCVVTVSELPDAAITVPKDAFLFVGEKGKTHFVKFMEIEPVFSVTAEDNTTYYFKLTDNGTYNYRVSGEEYITYGGTFKKTPDFTMSVTQEQLKPKEKNKTTVDRDTSSNNGYNVADIYLNINSEGHLKLSKDDTFQIVSLRNWEAVNNITANYFIEPDYHYEVIDENGNASDVAEVDENGRLTAVKSGTAIVLVTYDAMTLNFGADDVFYGAIYPENTGVFVISVDGGDSGIQTGITLNEGKNKSAIKLSGDALDSEHDCIYYAGEQGEYVFTPVSEDVNVSVANPVISDSVSYNGFTEIEKNEDNSVSVPLLTGRNIVKLAKDGKAEYQIITAKKVSVTVNNGETVHRGDTVSIVFDKLYHPANKLAGVYNMSAVAVYTDVSGYDGKLVGASSAQYNFANSSAAQTVSNVLKEKNSFGAVSYTKDTDLVIPSDYEYDTFTLSGGSIFVSGFGDSYGNHRAITYESGKGVNLNAETKLGYLGKLPDIKIPVAATDAELVSITLNAENVKTEYFVGDSFNNTGLVVTANYEDETTQIATNYSVSPEMLSADTENVTVTYRGKTAEIPVTVTNPKVTAIEIVVPPTKTAYKEGETFNPSGMVLNALYENGTKKETTEYSYSPTRELTVSDTEMMISYTGENVAENMAAVSQSITVSEKGGSVTSDKISVYVSLFGDEVHGTPSGKSDTHTKTKGNLDTWISKTKITLDKGSYVIDAIEKALSLNGIPYTYEGGYISEIKGLAEFDNGSLSGWMYTLNGKYPAKGIDEQKLSGGDVIVFHYTDDYTAEKTGYSSGGSPSSSKAKVTGSSEEETVTPVVTEKKDESAESQQSVFNEETYGDVKSDDWYYPAVRFTYEHNLMRGTDKGFEPEGKMTRAMLVTVLWRMEDEPAIDDRLTFKDVDIGQWYAEAVRWAVNKEIVFGIGNNQFGTDDRITREQLATILYRYALKKGLKMKENETNSLRDYEDSGIVSEYAVTAMEWAVGCGIVTGKTKTAVCPADTATRAEVAAMLMRFCEGIAQ